MLEFTKEQIGFIKKTKKQVQDLAKKQDLVYNKLVELLEIEFGGDEEDKLFDYIYNDFGSIKNKKD